MFRNKFMFYNSKALKKHRVLSCYIIITVSVYYLHSFFLNAFSLYYCVLLLTDCQDIATPTQVCITILRIAESCCIPVQSWDSHYKLRLTGGLMEHRLLFSHKCRKRRVIDSPEKTVLVTVVSSDLACPCRFWHLWSMVTNNHRRLYPRPFTKAGK